MSEAFPWGTSEEEIPNTDKYTHFHLETGNTIFSLIPFSYFLRHAGNMQEIQRRALYACVSGLNLTG